MQTGAALTVEVNSMIVIPRSMTPKLFNIDPSPCMPNRIIPDQQQREDYKKISKGESEIEPNPRLDPCYSSGITSSLVGAMFSMKLLLIEPVMLNVDRMVSPLRSPFADPVNESPLAPVVPDERKL